MRRLLVTLATLFVGISTSAQGTINFTTRIPGVVDAPVFGPDGVTGLGAFGGNAQLFLVSGGIYTALSPATTFRTTPAGLAQAYVVPPQTGVVVPNVPGGQQATVVMRSWLGPGYDTATFRGQSNPVTITLGGGGSPPAVPANLVGLQSFVTPFPEPSAIALGLFGAAALLYRRRKL